MVERCVRSVSAELSARVLEVMDLPATALPVGEYLRPGREHGFFQAALASLGYPGFACLGAGALRNPAEVLMAALDTDDLDARVTEALAWLPMEFPTMPWDWLTAQAKLADRQNRLGYVVELGRQAAGRTGKLQLEAELAARVAKLEPSRLAKEDTLCRESMTSAERGWLRVHRGKLADHWNLLTDLTVEQLSYVGA